MCGFLFSLLSIVLNIIAGFSEPLAGEVEDIGLGLLDAIFGCNIS